MKAIDAIQSSVVLNSAGLSFAFGRVDQGIDNNQRIGKAITHTGYEMRVMIERFAGTALSTSIRMVHGIWKQAYGGTPPTVTNVLESFSILASISNEFSSDLIILGDETFDLPALTGLAAGNAAGNETKTIIRRVSKKFVQQYTGTLSSNVSNWTHFVVFVQNTNIDAGILVGTRNYYTDA